MDSTRTGLGRLRASLDWLLILVFLLGLVAPTLDESWRPAEARGPLQRELREPAPRPPLPADLDALARFPRAYEEWYLDCFGLRDQLLRWGSCIKLFLFGVSPTPTVDIGRDGWMYFTGDQSVAAFRGTIRQTEQQLDAWQAMLENHATVCSELAIESLYVIGPNKETVYPERAPPWWNKVGPTPLEQLHDWLRAHGHGRARLLDLRPALLAAKAADGPGDFVYYQYGTHWNGRGCYVAYREVLTALQARLPIAPLPASAFPVRDGPDQGDTWGRAMYIDDLLPQRHIEFPPRELQFTETMARDGPVRVFEGPDPDAPRAIMFHDSFGLSILHMLAPHFSRFVCHETPAIDEAAIAREMPDVLLEIFVERLQVARQPQREMLERGRIGSRWFADAGSDLFELTRANLGASLRAHGGAQVGAMDTYALGAMTVSDATGCVMVAPFPLPPRADLILHVDLDSSIDTELRVLPVHGDGDGPDWQHGTAAAIHQGANSLHLRLPLRSRVAGIAMQPGGPGGIYVLHAFEVRALSVR